MEQEGRVIKVKSILNLIQHVMWGGHQGFMWLCCSLYRVNLWRVEVPSHLKLLCPSQFLCHARDVRFHWLCVLSNWICQLMTWTFPRNHKGQSKHLCILKLWEHFTIWTWGFFWLSLCTGVLEEALEMGKNSNLEKRGDLFLRVIPLEEVRFIKNVNFEDLNRKAVEWFLKS